MHRLTMVCNSCHNTARVWGGSLLTTSPRVPRYCLFCGADKGCVFLRQLHVDQFELIAELHDLPMEAIKELYRLWDPRDHQRFGDFVQEFKVSLEAK